MFRLRERHRAVGPRERTITLEERLGSVFWVTVFPGGWEVGGMVDSFSLLLLPLHPHHVGWMGTKGWRAGAVALVMLKYWLQVMLVK